MLRHSGTNTETLVQVTLMVANSQLRQTFGREKDFAGHPAVFIP